MQVDRQKNGCWSSHDLKGFTLVDGPSRWSRQSPTLEVVAEEGQPVEMPTKLMSHQAGLLDFVLLSKMNFDICSGCEAEIRFRDGLPYRITHDVLKKMIKQGWNGMPSPVIENNQICRAFLLPTSWLTVVDSVENKLKAILYYGSYFPSTSNIPRVPRVPWFPMARHDSCGRWKECETRWVEHCRVQDSEIG